MPDFINYNGNIVSEDEPVITADNRSFQYGDGIFETIRISNGNILFFDDHFDRLKRGSEFLKLKLPEFFNQKFLENKIFETAEINNISLNARVKITVFRSGKGKYEPETNDAGWIIKVSPLYRPDYLWNENGLTLGIFEKAQKTCDLSSNFKTTSSLIYVLASLEKIDSSFDESIILNIKGNIADAIYTNIFSVKEKQIFTPPLSEGAVDGVMRKQIIKIIKKMNFKLSEEPLNLESLENADEVFLTNTIKGIIWVKKFRRTQFSCHISFQLFKEINHIINIF